MTSPEYDEFELRLSSMSDGRYRVMARGPDDSRASETVELPFDERDVELLVARVGQPRRRTRSRSSTLDEAVRFGTDLFDTVMSGHVREVYQGARRHAQEHDRGLRVRLILSDAADVMSLPWEFLYERPGFVAQSQFTPIVRSLDLPTGAPPRTVRPPLQVLAMASTPRGYDNLNVDSERTEVEQALNRLTAAGAVRVRWLERATLAELHRAISAPDEIHVIHYIGHGAFDESTGDGELILENEHGGAHEVTGQELAWLLRDEHSIRLAVLNSCEGARTSAADPFSGVATSLIEAGIPAVIGMQFEITDAAAVTFAENFYLSLAQGLPVDAALANTRLAMWAHGHGTEFATPVLFLRGQQTRLFDVEGALVPAHNRRLWWYVAAAVAVVLAGVLIFALVPSGSDCRPLAVDFTSAEAAGVLTRMNDRGGKSTYDFIENRLEMNASPGTDIRTDLQGTVTAPFMYTTMPGDFTIETELFADPVNAYQGAGLLLFKDAHNYVRLERGYGDFDAIAFEYYQNGTHVKLNGPYTGDRAPTRTDADNVALRLTRVGDQVTAEWRDIPNNSEWQSLGTPAPLAGVARAGVTTLNTTTNSEPFTAAFTHLRTTCS